MIFNIGLNGVIVSRDIPEGWHKMNFRQFIDVAKAGNDMNKVISVLTGVDEETLKKAKIKNFDVLLSTLSFMQKPVNQIMPSAILGLTVPKNMEDEAAARYGDLTEITSKFLKDDNIGNLEYYPKIVATYVTPSPYNFKEADKLATQLFDAPCTEVLAIGNFTLLRLTASRNGMLNSSHLEGTLRNRLKRAILLWLNRLAFSIRYGTWKRQLRSKGMKF
jgi:hypothetical protein